MLDFIVDGHSFLGMVNLSGENKSGIKDLFRAGMKNLFGDEKIFSGNEKLGKKNPFWG
jgi:hypothetical protein